METLAHIFNDIADVQYSYIVCDGDFNIDFKVKHPLHDTICSAMDDLLLRNVNDKLPIGAEFFSSRVNRCFTTDRSFFLCQLLYMTVLLQLV